MGKMAAKTSATSRDDWVRFAFVLGMNLPFWALMLWATIAIGRTDAVRADGAPVVFAVVVGILHVSFGLTAAAQRASTRFVRVEDEAEELRHEGRSLLLGAGALIAAGSSMILLAVAGPDRLVPPVVGLAGAVLLTVAAMILVAVRRQGLDELGRIAERDSGYLAFQWFSLIGGSWGILAHLGFVAAPTPLHWLSMIWAFSFAGGILAAARKGVFDPPGG
jgi:hypothetical protein